MRARGAVRTRLQVAAAVAAVLAAGGARATTTLRLTRIDTPIVVDGRLDEEVWTRVEPLSLRQVVPQAGALPSERSLIRVAYDGNYLYAAGWFYDSDPAAIRGNRLQRDTSDGDDLFALILDTYNDNETAVAFYTTPAGTRIDETIANDGEWAGGPPINRDWNTFWDSAATRTREGWFAEMRIPFSSLRFQADGDHVVMGLIAWRHIARKTETATFPGIPPEVSNGQIKPSLAADVEMEGISTRSPIRVTPYVLGNVGRSVELLENDDDDVTGFERRRDRGVEVGADLKVAVTSNLNLDVTLNTDFAQVEADDAQVNLSRFSLFQPEKRLFFQERSSIFEFGTGNQDRLFYSRQIGLDEDGETVRILGGVRLVGRIGGWDVGALDMQTEGNDLSPSENLGVFRVRRQVFNEGSSVGGIVTSRLGSDGRYNLGFGADTTLRFPRGDEVVARWAQTVDRDVDGVVRGGADAGRLFIEARRRTRQGWGYDVVAGWSGKDHDPGLGFVAREDYRRFASEIQYHRNGIGGDSFRHNAYWLGGGGFWRNQDGALETGDYGFGANVQLRSGTWLWTDVRAFRENLDESFELTDAIEVPGGAYSWWGVSAGVNLPAGRNVSLRGNAYYGGFYDGTRRTLRVAPDWTISRHLSVGGFFEVNAIRFPHSGEGVDFYLGRAKVRYALSSALTVDLFSQYSSRSGDMGTNLRLRYTVTEGTDLWVVLGDALNTESTVNGVAVPRDRGRALTVKYAQTLSF